MRIARKQRDLLLIALLALAVRLWWNLAVHPPLDFAFSDMGGYLERAQTSIDFPDDPRPYFTLFPWGTHGLLALVKRAFGRDNGAAIGVTYAVLGALAVAYSFATARRLTRSPRLARAVGLVLVAYYPWIALGGYTLSEPPFTLFLCAVAYHGLAYADRGRARDAWLFGGAVALATIFRPQVLAALPLYAVHALWRRRAWHRLRLAVVVPAIAAPLALVAVVSAARVHFHTGHYGFVSSNGPLNFAFGRCHPTTITSSAPDCRGAYSPPSLGWLAAHEAANPDSFFRLDPAMGVTLDVKGHMWDAAPFVDLASECERRTGPARQARYALTHVALLWFFNTTWPDGSQPRFRPAMEIAQALHDVLVLPAALAALALSFHRTRARALLLALHVVALAVVAVVYFGDTRLRVPYDGILVILAATMYAAAANAICAWRRAPAVATPSR